MLLSNTFVSFVRVRKKAFLENCSKFLKIYWFGSVSFAAPHYIWIESSFWSKASRIQKNPRQCIQTILQVLRIETTSVKGIDWWQFWNNHHCWQLCRSRIHYFASSSSPPTLLFTCLHVYFWSRLITSNHLCHQGVWRIFMLWCFDELVAFDHDSWCCDDMMINDHVMTCLIRFSLWAHLTGSGSESSLPEVSSVVASGRIVVISIGMESTAPSATKRKQPRNFSISP